MRENSKGTTVDTITISAAMNYLCIVPPQNEQVRIVAAVQQAIVKVNEIQFNKDNLHSTITILVNNNISSQYLLKIIASDTIQDYFKSSLKGIGVPNLHLEHIRTTLIPIPPINEQNKIAERIYQYYSLLDSIVQNIE